MKRHIKLLLLTTLLPFFVSAQNQSWTDVTGFIANPAFTNNRSFGWTREYSGGGVTSIVQYECMEVWNGVCDIHQTLKGLPKGKYRLFVQAFYREASQRNAYPRWNDRTDNITAVLYAGNAEQKLRSNYEYSFTSNVADTCWTPNQQIFYPNGMASTRVAFDNDAYINMLDFEADGDIEIGIKNDVYEYDNWVIFDNFRLEYMGNITPVSDIVLNINKTTLTEGDCAFVSAAVLPQNATIKNLSYYSSDPFVFSINQKGEMVAIGAGTAVLTVMTNDEKVKKEVVITVEKKKPDDDGTWKEMPNIIINPTFDTDGNSEGWNTEYFNGTTAVRSGSMEFWNTENFKASQTIDNLPKGHYRLCVQGFHRYGRPVADYDRLIDNSQTSFAYIFVNGQKKTLVPYCSHYEQTKPGDEWTSPDGGHHWMPNTMESASEAFANDAYWNYLEFDVEKEVEDVTIGVGLDEYSKENWCIFTNFKLKTSVEIDLGKTYMMSVQDESSNDLTSKVSIIWYDGQGNELGTGSSIGGIKKNAELYYSVLFDQSLGMKYYEVVKEKVNKENETVVCQLKPIETLTVHGRVSAYGTSLPRVNVSLTQWLNGKYEYETSTLTDANGEFSLQAYNDSTELIVTANGYIDNKTACRYLNKGGELGTIEMTEVSGKVIALRLSYQEATKEGAEPIVQSWYNDTRNIDYSVYNETKGKVVEDYAIQQGNIVLPTGTDRGDNIRITLRSLNEKFSEITANATIADNDTAKVSISLLAFGGIEATYGQKADDNLLAMLYDSTGKLQMRTVSSTSRLTFTNLAAGNYTLIAMGYNGAIGSVADIADLANMDLAEGTDYVRSTATVRDGYITLVNVASVPELDASKFEYTGTNTSYLPNKMQLVAGNFITLAVRLDFKEQYAGETDNAKVVVDIPDGCEFVPNSVVIGAKPLPHSLNGNKLTITVDKDDIDRRIRFCIIPTQTGTYMTTAYAEFDYKGIKTQPIGQIRFESTSGEFYVPSTTRTSTIAIGGIGVPKAEVEIYDNGNLIGLTRSLANGKWSLSCELANAYNLSMHNICIKYRGESKVVSTTETKSCLYDKNAIVVKSVTMLNTAHPAGNLTPTVYKTVFDFINQTTIPNYYSYWPQYPEFTFLVDFTDNDTTKISNVTLYVYTTSGDVRELTPEYDSKQGKFVAVGSFNSFGLPTNVGVDFTADTEHQLSRMALDNGIIDIDSISNMTNKNLSRLNTLIEAMNGASDDVREEFQDEILSMLGVKPTEEDYEFVGVSELFADVEESLKNSEELIDNTDANGMLNTLSLSIFQDVDLSQFEMDGRLSVKTCDGINFDDLIEQGYTAYPTDNGDVVYVLQNELGLKYIDQSKNIVIEIGYDENTVSEARAIARALKNDPIGTIWEYSNNVYRKAVEFKSLLSNICSIIDDVIIEPLNGKISNYDTIIKCNLRQENALSKLAYETDNSQVYEDCMKELQRLRAKNEVLYKQMEILNGTLNVALRILSAATSLYGIFDNMVELSRDLQAYVELYNGVPDCFCNPSMKTSLQRRIAATGVARGAMYFYDIASNVVALKVAFGSVAAAPVTGGSSLSATAVSISALLAKQLVLIGLSEVSEHLKRCYEGEIRAMVRNSKCWICPNPNPNPNPNPDPNPNPNPNPNPGGGNGATPKEDPSGYVYEAVPTNRLEGVKATLYYSEDEDGDFPVMWNAEEYGEVNPQITDESGLYAWDVPQGFWKVIFEKDGYETTETEWLPVPPPQLEINIPMSQAVAPYVESAMGVESGITLEFSKYMKPNTLTRNRRVTVTVNGENVSGDVQLLNAEQNPFNKEEYASKIKFVPNTSFKTTDEVIISVKKEVQSYAGMEMTEDFVQIVKIESEITEIACDSVIAIDYQGTGFLELSVLPAAAAKGKTIQVASTSDMIASTNAQSITLNDEGKARITVSGELPGNASLHLSMPEVGKEKYVAVNVVTKEEDVVKTPKASKLSGSTIEKDYPLTLTCATNGATIYYTIDGSCPCDEQTRKKYTGPIILPGGQRTLRAIAVRDGMIDSEIAEYIYVVKNGPLEYYTYEGLMKTLEDCEGWTAVLAQNPNAVAVAENSQAEWALQQENALVKNTDDSYTCADFLLADLSQGYSSSASEAAKTGFFTPVSFTATKGTYKRQAYAGYNTLCLPFNINVSELSSSAKVFTFASYDADKAKIVFKAVSGTIAAGTPCIVKEKTNVVWTVDLAGKTIVANQPSEESHMRGTYVTTDQYQGIGYSPRSSDNVFAPLTKYLHPFRACFSIEDLNNAGARGSIDVVFVDEDGVTVIDEISATGRVADAPKTIYTLGGQRINEIKRSGLYIVDGEKVYVEVE